LVGGRGGAKMREKDTKRKTHNKYRKERKKKGGGRNCTSDFTYMGSKSEEGKGAAS